MEMKTAVVRVEMSGGEAKWTNFAFEILNRYLATVGFMARGQVCADF
jgi:hypothetical protein